MTPHSIHAALVAVCASVLLLFCAPGTAGPVVATSDGANGVRLALPTPHSAAGADEVRFLVPHVRSAVFGTAGGGRVTTVIAATNGGAAACNVTVDFFFAFNSDAVPECSVTVALQPLLSTGADTMNVCSRSIPGDRWTLCTASCSPELSFVQGKALVRAPASCAGGLAIDARMYHSDTSDDVKTINTLRVMRLRD